MLKRSEEMDDATLPIVSVCLITDRNRCPPNFTPILKSHDDQTDADLWREGGFSFGLFNRTVRYIAINRIAPENSPHEVVTDLAIINEKEAVPTNFVCIDYTADTKERALRKKFICCRFTPRNDAIDAVTDLIVLNKSKRPPKGFTSAGEIDGALICFKVTTIPPTYGTRPTPQPAAVQAPIANPTSIYPQLDSDLSLTMRAPFVSHRPLDGVPFKLSPKFEPKGTVGVISQFEVQTAALDSDYNFRLERSIVN
ncbi:hypothetical protein M3Y98_00986300 [Aphelenchoides besseyi]|nr:hypothetical protein M3Y98_00986300 [Aphelenchoides besseyi]KAI6194856.1 hypothetical protein M3Y96_01169600 [Aphelenchoides besseyi]